MKIFILIIAIFLTIFPQISNAKDTPINIKKDMPYANAKKILIRSGWQAVIAHTTPNGTPVCFKNIEVDVKDKMYSYNANQEACKYEEINDCSGSGMGFCGMSFFDGDETYLSITTYGGEPPDAQIHGWKKVKKNRQSVSNDTQNFNKTDIKKCHSLLGAGIYNGVLENSCNFNGGVKDKLLSLYDKLGCRTIVPQKTVDITAADVLSDTRKRYKAMGHIAFCNGNIDAYNALQK